MGRRPAFRSFMSLVVSLVSEANPRSSLTTKQAGQGTCRIYFIGVLCAPFARLKFFFFLEEGGGGRRGEGGGTPVCTKRSRHVAVRPRSDEVLFLAMLLEFMAEARRGGRTLYQTSLQVSCLPYVSGSSNAVYLPGAMKKEFD
jgi:hypothetical protein